MKGKRPKQLCGVCGHHRDMHQVTRYSKIGVRCWKCCHLILLRQRHPDDGVCKEYVKVIA